MRNKISSAFLAGVLTFLLFFMTFAPVSYAAATVRVLVDGSYLDFDVPPIIENDRTLAPFRKIGEALGAEIEWDQDTKTVTAYKHDRTVILRIGEKIAYVNDEPVELDVPPTIKNDRTLVPVRFFSEAFGARVSWDNASRTVVIYTGEKPSKYILGYYYSQSYQDFLENLDNMSSTAVKWYTLDEYGDLTDRDNTRYISVPQGYEEVIRLSKANGIEIQMLVFEGDSKKSAEKLSKVLGTPESRARLANQIVTVVDREGYDGVNLDFEYLGAADKDNYNEFTALLYKELKARGKSLSISLPVKTEKADWWPGYDYVTLGRNSDFVVLMAYDKNPGTAGPQSGVDWVEEVVDYAIARIPAEKVVLGIGYYGYDWGPSGRSSVILRNNGATYLKFAEELSKKYGFKLQLDERSGMYYAKYTDENGNSHQLWMESDYSVDKKAKMVINKGLKGVALWRLGYSSPSFWETLLNNFDPVKFK